MNSTGTPREQLVNEPVTLRHRIKELEAADLRRNEELDALAHSIVHDIRAPLAYMVGLTHVLQEDFAALSDEELRHYLAQIAERGHKISNVIDKLLVLAGVRRVEAVPIDRLDMGSIVAEAQRRLADLIGQRGAEIILPEAWPAVLGYDLWVEEVWVNYISNAVKHGGRSPRVELGYSVSNPKERIPDSPPEQDRHQITDEQSTTQRVRFWVRDNGPGLAPEEQTRLFTPHIRLDTIHTRGHGLGLSIVQRIVERLGGQVEVESNPGKGSIFRFSLPRAEGPRKPHS